MQKERYYMDEIEIDLVDLCKVLLSKWKLIGIGALCGLFIALGSTAAKPNATVPTKEQVMESLTDAERNNVEDLYQYYYVMNRRIDVLRTLLYSDQINSLELNEDDRVMKRTYYAVNSSFSGMNYVASETMLDSGNYAELSNILYGDDSHVAEVSQRVALKCITDTERQGPTHDYGDSSDTGTANEVMILTVVGADKEKVEQASSYVEQIISGKRYGVDGLEMTVNIHKIDSQYSEDRNAIVQALYTSFDTLSQSLYNAEYQLNYIQTNYISKLSGNSKTYYSLLNGETLTAASKNYKKNGLLGLILGIIAVCGWFAVKYVLDGKVKTASELSWLLKGDKPYELYTKSNSDSTDSSHELVAEDIVIRLKQNDKKKLFITADEQIISNPLVQETIASIKEKLNGKIVVGNPCASANDMRVLSESDAVVMVVLLKQETRKTVNQIEQICRGYNKEIIGVITL